jgi:hypothetical protein
MAYCVLVGMIGGEFLINKKPYPMVFIEKVIALSICLTLFVGIKIVGGLPSFQSLGYQLMWLVAGFFLPLSPLVAKRINKGINRLLT